jgi:hypothetical protein
MRAVTRERMISIMAVVLVISICFLVPKAAAQSDKYSKMAPVNQYLIEIPCNFLMQNLDSRKLLIFHYHPDTDCNLVRSLYRISSCRGLKPATAECRLKPALPTGGPCDTEKGYVRNAV